MYRANMVLYTTQTIRCKQTHRHPVIIWVVSDILQVPGYDFLIFVPSSFQKYTLRESPCPAENGDEFKARFAKYFCTLYCNKGL